VIVVRRSRSGRHITKTKTKKPRVFSISPRLAARLGSPVDGRQPDEPLFLTSEGKRLYPDNFVKRKLTSFVKPRIHSAARENTPSDSDGGIPSRPESSPVKRILVWRGAHSVPLVMS
jgi:hypothetical protein